MVAILNSLSHPICLLALTILAFFALFGNELKRASERYKQLWLLALALFGLWQYTMFGQFIASRHLHVHDFSHYFLGGKYFEELGYKNLYRAWALGLEEGLSIKVEQIRNLRDKSKYENWEEVKLHSDEIRGLFSPLRWRNFVSDIRGLHKVAPEADWAKMVRDAGFNPSPAWLLFSRCFSWISPSLWIVLSSIDAILLAACFCFLGRTFGWTNSLFGLCLVFYFPSGEFSSYRWTGGSFLRWSWLFWLTLGFCALQRKWMLIAGFAFAIAGLERLFPIGFALGAFISTCAAAFRSCGFAGIKTPSQNEWRHALALGFGGTMGACAVYLATEMLWPGSWMGFVSSIQGHTQFLFTNHFGWWRAISFYPEMGKIGFSENVPSIFADWSQIMAQRLYWPFFMVWMVFVLISIWILGPMRLPPLASAILMGFSFIFYSGLPAHYYLVFLLPLAGIVAAGQFSVFYSWTFWLLWPFCSLVTMLPETLGWALASVLMAVFLTLHAFYLIVPAKNRHRVSIICCLGIVVFCVYGLTIAPESGRTPPRGWEGAVPASYSRPNAFSRSFPDYTARIINDQGLALEPDVKLELLKPSVIQSEECTIIIRTDRLFPGHLDLLSGSKLLHSWEVQARGYIFDYLNTHVACDDKLFLRWNGPGKDIGLFQAWMRE